ncbi:hypothetical protein [Microbulbifer thermotolerans]|uniref:Uncharacterized protein n=1 Tax=Microbulbifer thermotolerans TaxID=252514 RepID=A0A143HHR7_MICTH|nr:hypothetical protein [Microbulbifer thermotolerans]AMX01265.1 hypothetical protein A3224_00535 [Microbulbifer thermotolerans]MCX2778968.1 hypothetical protein [Microbulbifer thermotolerans]MCX2806434.1 hypothetical protein [Microbulbifer thermotolerans]MCX2835090.1 hypothetical protein [Microbulbifer thermotolerans]
MNITELHNLISEVAESLPENESRQLLEIRDSLEDLGPSLWTSKLAKFANDMLDKSVGDWQKLSMLESEAESNGSIEIKPVYIFVALVIILVGVVYFA